MSGAGPTREAGPAGVPVTVEGAARATAEATFDVIVPIDLTRIFEGYGPLPAVIATRGQTGGWNEVGERRVVELSDGSEAGEQITSYERPGHFAYRVGPFKSAPLRHLVMWADGEWWFGSSTVGETAIRWRYTFQPRRFMTLVVRLAIAPLWRGYARRVLGLAIAEVERRGVAPG